MACIKSDAQKFREGVHPLSIIRNNIEQFKLDCMFYLSEKATPEGIYDNALQTCNRLGLSEDTVDEYKPQSGTLNKE